jgi:hypothetical protein
MGIVSANLSNVTIKLYYGCELAIGYITIAILKLLIFHEPLKGCKLLMCIRSYFYPVTLLTVTVYGLITMLFLLTAVQETADFATSLITFYHYRMDR